MSIAELKKLAVRAPAKPKPATVKSVTVAAPADVDQGLVNAVADTTKAAGEAHVALFVAAMRARVQPSQLMAAYAAVGRPMNEATAKVRASAYNSAGRCAKVLGPDATADIIRDAAGRAGEVRELVYTALRQAVELAKAAGAKGAKAAELQRIVREGLAKGAAAVVIARRAPRAPRMVGETARKGGGLRALAASHLALLEDLVQDIATLDVRPGEAAKVRDIESALEALQDAYKALVDD